MAESVVQRLHETALGKGLRRSTVLSYERLLGRLGVLDLPVEEVTRDLVLERLFDIDNPNTRRAAVVAVRSVLGLDIKIPRGVPRRYDLPSEDTLLLALMMSPHQVRGLLMMYGGLRLGEACAVTRRDLTGDRLRVDKQVVQLHQKGHQPTVKVGPVKTSVGSVTLPPWLCERVEELTETVKPDSVRESLWRAGRKVGIRLNPHMLRHWCATELLARGVPLIAVAEHMRHADVAITLRTYAQADTPGEVHRAFG